MKWNLLGWQVGRQAEGDSCGEKSQNTHVFFSVIRETRC